MAIDKSGDVTNPIKQRALDSIAQSEENAEAKKKKAQAQYDFMFQQYEAICAKRSSIMSQLKYNPNDKDLKNLYKQIDSSLFDAEIGWECARDKLQGSLSYYSKVNTAAYFANSQLA